MARNLSAFIAGLVFSLGLTISHMVNPTKVLAFLDVFGDWDPSLALVMGAALAVTTIGYRLAWRRGSPAFAERFELPTDRAIDAPLALGAVLFGVGWGLAGLCPGPAIAALSIGNAKALGFAATMAIGMAMFELTPTRRRKREIAQQ